MGSNLSIAQLTGAICRDGAVYHPGIWLVVREANAAGKEMSPTSRARIASVAESVRSTLQLS